MSCFLKTPVDIYTTVSSFETYFTYPYTYYIDGRRVDSYVIKYMDKQIVVQHIVSEDVAVVDVVDASTTPPRVLEDPSELIEALFRDIEAGKYIAETPHEVRGLSVLTTIPESVLRELFIRERYVNALRDKYVAIIGENIYVFRKTPPFFERYEGLVAVETAREVSIVSESPISSMSKHLVKNMEPPLTFFSSHRDHTIVCNHEKCVDTPLPRNISLLAVKHISRTSGRAVFVNVLKPHEYRNTEIHIPTDIIVFTRMNVILVEKTREKEHRVVERIKTENHVGTPVVFTRKGFAGHGVVVKDTGKIVKVIYVEKTGEEGVFETEITSSS